MKQTLDTRRSEWGSVAQGRGPFARRWESTVWPELFSVFGVGVQSYGVSKALALLVGAYLLGRAFDRIAYPKVEALGGLFEKCLRFEPHRRIVA